VAPTLVASYNVNTGSTANGVTLTTAAFTPAVGEIIVVKMGSCFPDSPTIGVLSSTGGLSFTQRDDVKTSGKAPARLSTAQVGSSSSMTISCTFTTDTGQHFMLVERWSGAALDATPTATSPKTGSAGTAPNTGLTTEVNNSVVTWFITDYSESTGTRTYRSSATEVAFQQVTGYSWYAAYQSAATAGAQVLGMTAPTQNWTLLGIELQDASGPATVLPTSIASAESIGAPVVAVTGANQTVTAAGAITSGESFGSPTVVVTQPDQTVTVPGITSGEAFGSPVVALSSTDQTVVSIGITTGEAFGSPTVAVGGAALVIGVTGTDSAEAFGVPTVAILPPDQTVDGAGAIETAELFGLPVIAIETAVPGSYIRDTYLIDSVDLNSYAWRIETAEGTLTGPATVGDNPPLPGRDGVAQVFAGPGQQRRPDDVGTITFNMWLLGVDVTTGLIPGGSSSGEQWYTRWDELVRLFYRRRVTIDHPRLDGTRRAVDCYLLPGQSVGPSRVPSSPWFGRLKATFAIPGTHWTDISPVTTGSTALTTNGLLSLGAFAGSTAPCTDLTVTFGAGNNPRLSTSYNFVGWNQVISAGRQLGIDTAAGVTHQAGGTGWPPGYDPLVYSPGPRYFEVDPSEPLTAVLTHTGGGSVTVEVAGKRHYRTS